MLPLHQKILHPSNLHIIIAYFPFIDGHYLRIKDELRIEYRVINFWSPTQHQFMDIWINLEHSEERNKYRRTQR